MHGRQLRRRDGGRWLVALLGGCSIALGSFAVPELAHGVVHLVVHPGARRAPEELPSSGLRSGGQRVGPVAGDRIVLCGAAGANCSTEAGIPAQSVAQNSVATGELVGAGAPSSTADESELVAKTAVEAAPTSESAGLAEPRASMVLVEVANPWWPEGRGSRRSELEPWSLASDIIDPWGGHAHGSLVSSELGVIVNPWR